MPIFRGALHAPLLKILGGLQPPQPPWFLHQCSAEWSLESLYQIVGGMTWCIQTCSIDVDVDLLFQENSTIGQRM